MTKNNKNELIKKKNIICITKQNNYNNTILIFVNVK